jgi:WD40 repeat protein
LRTSYDNTARVWDVEKGVSLAEFRGHTDVVQQAAFSPDGRFVATTGGDCSLRVWGVGSGQNLLVFPGDLSCFSAPRFTPEGPVIATNLFAIKGYPPANDVDIFPCKVCVDAKHLLSPARQRVTRSLLPAEKARYLQ